ncbi:RTA1-like protein [Flammula alnicola]|nr:RTA1-like protein [Flammula alnicola]
MSASNDIAFIVARAHHNFHGSPYHYIPTEGVAITFITLYALSTLIHAGQAVFYRMWWLLPTVCLCGVLEVIGWSARLWSSFSPSLSTPFEMQITATILGPTPLLAANFVIFGVIIQRLGTQYSRLSPKWYTILFCTCDVISLVVQAVGGGKAAVASGNGLNPTPGGNIMLGGISFQLFTITIYAMCASEFYVRYSRNWPIRRASGETKDEGLRDGEPMGGKISLMSAALLFSTTCLFIRAVYRTIELSNGWNGRIISTQVLFNVLDGGMVTLAMYTINFAHPGLLLGHGSGLTNKSAADISEKEAIAAE